MNSLTDLQVQIHVYLEHVELGNTNILCYINTTVLVILGERFLVLLRSFNGSDFNFRFPGCPALRLLLFLWECVRVSLRLCLLVLLQLRVCPELKASALSERVQWIVELPGFSWNLKIDMAAHLFQLTPHEAISRTLDIFLGSGGGGGGGVAGLVHSTGCLGSSGFLD